MSSRAKTLEKTLLESANMDVFEMQNSLIGSIVMSVAILNKNSLEEALQHYRQLRDDLDFKPANIIEAVRAVIRLWGKAEDLQNLCLVTDKENLRTPGVFPCVEDEDKIVPVPLSKEWKLTSILLYFYTNPDKCDVEMLDEYTM